MDAIPRKPLAADAPLDIDFQALPLARLQDMEAAAFEVIESYRSLAAAGATVTGEVLKGQGPFVQWDHYPAGDVYDWSSHSQYYYHAHPPDHRGNEWGEEHGHFHTFLRAQGMPADARPADVPGAAAAAGCDESLSHIVAISMSREGLPVRLFTTNRWVTGEQWYDAETIIGMIDRFKIESAVPSRAVNNWITGMLRLFRPQIEMLLRRRDAALKDWQARHATAALSAYDDRDLEVASVTAIAVDGHIDALATALQARCGGVPS